MASASCIVDDCVVYFGVELTGPLDARAQSAHPVESAQWRLLGGAVDLFSPLRHTIHVHKLLANWNAFMRLFGGGRLTRTVYQKLDSNFHTRMRLYEPPHARAPRSQPGRSRGRRSRRGSSARIAAQLRRVEHHVEHHPRRRRQACQRRARDVPLLVDLPPCAVELVSCAPYGCAGCAPIAILH